MEDEEGQDCGVKMWSATRYGWFGIRNKLEIGVS